MAISLPIAPQPLAAIAPATSRWIDDALGRHTVTLLCYVAGIAFTGAIGVRVDWHTYVVMAVWIGYDLVIAPWAARPHDFQKKLTPSAWTSVMDVLFLGAVFSWTVGFVGIWLFSILDRSPRAKVDRAGFPAQQVRSETGIGASGASGH